MTDRLADMLQAQLDLQRRHGWDPLVMDLPTRIAYIKENVLALTDELHEALGEVGWKSWATSRHINSEAAFGELRDAWQFLTNLMFAVSPDSPTDLAARLERELYAKLKVNHVRHDEGYDGVSTKCPNCARALDETPINEVHLSSGRAYQCSACSWVLDSELVINLLRD